MIGLQSNNGIDGDGWIEQFARIQHPEANHEQLAHRGHDDLFGLKATSVLQACDVAARPQWRARRLSALRRC
jgi:hypothetical protein